MTTASSFEEDIRSHWSSILENLTAQTDSFAGVINKEVDYKINAWRLSTDEQKKAYKIAAKPLIIQFVEECRNSDRSFCDRTVNNIIFMMNLWEQAGLSKRQIEQEGHQHNIDTARELRAHCRAKEIRFDTYLDKKRDLDNEFQDDALRFKKTAISK